MDIGLTPHDLRRTLGRYAERIHGTKARVVSQMLHHRIKDKDSAATDAIYTARYKKSRQAAPSQ